MTMILWGVLPMHWYSDSENVLCRKTVCNNMQSQIVFKNTLLSCLHLSGMLLSVQVLWSLSFVEEKASNVFMCLDFSAVLGEIERLAPSKSYNKQIYLPSPFPPIPHSLSIHLAKNGDLPFQYQETTENWCRYLRSKIWSSAKWAC